MKDYPIYLAGELKLCEETFPVTNPATGEAFARMSCVSRETVAEAIKQAHEAFLKLRLMTGKGRGELLLNIANELNRRREEAARLITMENGKPLSQSQGEVAMAVDHLRWFAEEARRGYGRVIPHQSEDKRHIVLKVPLGVVGAISPWNFPLMLAVRKVAPAIAAGCSVVLKPASRTPISATLFAECVNATAPPKNIFQLVCGKAEEIAGEFMDNPLCRKITFTGSTSVGKQLIRAAAQFVKPLSLELGGHAPAIVFDDTSLAEAVSGVLVAKFRNTGQSCIAANRIYVQRKIYEPFLKALVDRVKAMKVGEGLDPQTEIGPLIDEEALSKAEEHVQDAVRGGGRLLCGGKRIPRSGYFFEPTVIAEVPRGSLCMHEETFAPIAPVLPFDNEAEAVEQANTSPYGLSAYVFTRDISRMFRLGESLEVGMIGVNDGVPSTSQAPFGGVKQSGWGRELGSEGMEEFLETRHLSIGI